MFKSIASFWLLFFGVTVSEILMSLPSQALDFTLGDEADPVLLWNDVALKAISDTPLGPTPVSRALGIVNTSMFDAWAAYDEVAIGTQLGHLQAAKTLITTQNKYESISYAAYNTLVDLFPSEIERFNHLMTRLGYDYTNTSTDISSAAGIGNRVASALLDFRHNDGSNQLNGYADTSGYEPVNRWNQIVEPARWQPLSLDNGETIQQFLTPHWGEVTPFALESGDRFLPPPPEPFLDGEGNLNQGYLDQAIQLIEYSAELTDEQKVIVEYWADGPQTTLPPGHWHQFGLFVAQRDRLTLDENVQLFFALGNAVFDAGIAAWSAKKYYDYARPITAIQYLAENGLLPKDHPYIRTNPGTGETEIFAWAGPNQGSQWITGSQWLPYQKITFVTPPFAEYVSGHSTFSAASAEILAQFTKSDRLGACHIQEANSATFESNTPAEAVELCWNTFSEAADEAGISRRYGGIHFQDGDIQGRILGRQVGTQVWQETQIYINGGKKVPEPASVSGLLLATALGVASRRKH